MEYHFRRSVDASGVSQTEVDIKISSLETLLRGSVIEGIIIKSVSNFDKAYNASSAVDPETYLQASEDDNAKVGTELGFPLGDFLVALALAVLSVESIFLEKPVSIFTSWLATFISIEWAIRKLYLGCLSTKPCKSSLHTVCMWCIAILAACLAAFLITAFMSSL